MKKFVIIALITVMVAGAAFAQTADGISVNAWGRGVFAPLQVVGAEKIGDGKTKQVTDADGKLVDDKASVYTGSGVTWGGSKARTDFRINGNAEFAGFQAQFNAEDPSVGDNMYLWAKPFSNDLVKLSIGHFLVDDLRGKIDSDTGFENFIVGDMAADTIFTRISAGASDGKFTEFGDTSGFLLSSAPIEGLFIGFRVNGALFRDWGGNGSGNKAGDAYRFMQLALGYNIADIGHFRAQYIGGWLGTVTKDKVKKLGDNYDLGPLDIGYPDWCYDDDGDLHSWVGPEHLAYGWRPSRIEAAFAITAIENLLVDLGFKFWLPITLAEDSGYSSGGFPFAGVKYSNGVNVALGAKYRMEAFQIVAHINSGFGGYTRGLKDDKHTEGLDLQVNLLPSYDLEAFTIGASLGAKLGFSGRKNEKGEKQGTGDTAKFGFGAYAQKGLGSGNARIGLAYTTAEIRTVKDKDGNKAAAASGAFGSGVFSIPIILEYAFF